MQLLVSVFLWEPCNRELVPFVASTSDLTGSTTVGSPAHLTWILASLGRGYRPRVGSRSYRGGASGLPALPMVGGPVVSRGVRRVWLSIPWWIGPTGLGPGCGVARSGAACHALYTASFARLAHYQGRGG